MAIEFSPGGRGILILVATAVVIVVWLQTSGAMLTLGVIAVVIAIVTLLLWGVGVRIARRAAGGR
ncbi:MAG: hypothetical protein ACOCQV_02840 [Halolamina sp.]